MSPEPFVGIGEAASLLSVKTSWLYEAVRLGKIPSYKVGAFRRFRLSELEAWMEKRREGGGECPNLARPLLAAERSTANNESRVG